MQKYILKQQFEGFSVSNSEGLHKGYDRFQSLLSQLEIHGAGVSTEDVNQKFLSSLPSAWSQVSLIMRTKPGVDNLSFDDMYNNLSSIEKKIKISLIVYSKLNKIKEYFGKRFVTQKELSAEQAFWLKHSSFSETPVISHTPVRIEAYSELPKVVKKRTTSDAITAGAWGFEHTKACFVTEILPVLKVLKDTFNAFDKTLLDEITELSIDNDQLLKQIRSQEIMHVAVNSVDILDVKKSSVNDCNKCLELETELLKKKDWIDKDVYDKLLKSYSTLQKH
ncbi:hypothetical protein Tco_1409484 [Tanacetum coccineum]